MNIAACEDRKRCRRGCLPGALGAVPMLIGEAYLNVIPASGGDGSFQHGACVFRSARHIGRSCRGGVDVRFCLKPGLRQRGAFDLDGGRRRLDTRQKTKDGTVNE